MTSLIYFGKYLEIDLWNRKLKGKKKLYYSPGLIKNKIIEYYGQRYKRNIWINKEKVWPY